MVRAFHFVNSIYALATLRTGQIKVSRFNDLNDPFELYAQNLSIQSHRERFRCFKHWADERFGLLCFSHGWRNPLLWSHYAEKHRGVALEFILDEDIVSEISYSPNRLRIDIERRISEGSFTEDDAYRLATTKSKHWKYEEELRVFVNLAQCHYRKGLYFERLGKSMHITRIILGPLCTLSFSEIEEALMPGEQIGLVQTRLAFTSFSVVRNRSYKERVASAPA